MTKIIALAVTAMLANPALGRTLIPPYACQDKGVNVMHNNGRITVALPDRNIEIEPADLVVSGFATGVVNKRVWVSGKGQKASQVLNGLFVFDEEAQQINVTVLLDGKTVLAGQSIACD